MSKAQIKDIDKKIKQWTRQLNISRGVKKARVVICKGILPKVEVEHNPKLLRKERLIQFIQNY